ncbi:hypothetical protein ZEAMMB73_Zm00001d050347 [Zea mays]|uniref:Uncharacterized protein n=1 Tax=Zea mays TaxID=4577 RepID=A0A1D6Q191_MAIZE|nr:hypothetical protein ZEAMMB73_Zm00001d050347 [Zea mays]
MDVDGPAPADASARPATNGEAPSGAREVDVGEEDTLAGVLRSFVDGVWYPDEPLLRRLRAASCDAAPRLRGASRNSARDLLEWTRRGSGLRAILVISVGTITLIALTGLLTFMFFLLVATANAIIVSVLMSLAAAGGFLAIFFACLVAVYIGAVSVAIFVISATVISAVVGILVATALTKNSCRYDSLEKMKGYYDAQYLERLGWVLLDYLVHRKEEHGPDEALLRHDELGNPIVFRVPASEAEACRLRLVGCVLYEADISIYVNHGFAVCLFVRV